MTQFAECLGKKPQIPLSEELLRADRQVGVEQDIHGPDRPDVRPRQRQRFGFGQSQRAEVVPSMFLASILCLSSITL